MMRTVVVSSFVIAASNYVLLGSARAIDDAFPAVGQCEWPTSVQLLVKPAAGHPAGYLDTEWYPCSGLFVGDLMLTVGHCVAYMQTIMVHFGEGKTLPGAICPRLAETSSSRSSP